MTHFPHDATDAEIIGFADRWAALLEREDYEAAHTLTLHDPYQGWTPVLMREVIQAYGEERPGQKVTLLGEPTDIRQRKDVTRYGQTRHKSIGYLWYDLNIDGYASDLTATFDIVEEADGLSLQLSEIHVM